MVPGSFPRCYCSSSLLGANQSGQNLFAMPSHCGGYCLVAGATLIWYWSRCRTPMNSSYRPRVITLQIGQIQITRRKSVTFWAASICTGASSTVVDKFRVLRLIILNVFWIDAVSLHQRNARIKWYEREKDGRDDYRNWSVFSRLRMIDTANLAAWEVSNSTSARLKNFRKETWFLERKNILILQ